MTTTPPQVPGLAINVTFTETSKDPESGKPITLYSLDIIDNGKYKVVKVRYRIVLLLNQKVRMSLNVIRRSDLLSALPKLPAKRFFKNLTPEVIRARKQAISEFMKSLAEIACEEPSIHRLVTNLLAEVDQTDKEFKEKSRSRGSSIENMDIIVYKGTLYMMNIKKLNYEWVKRFVFLKNDKLYLYSPSGSTLLSVIDLNVGGCVGFIPASSIPNYNSSSEARCILLSLPFNCKFYITCESLTEQNEWVKEIKSILTYYNTNAVVLGDFEYYDPIEFTSSEETITIPTENYSVDYEVTTIIAKTDKEIIYNGTVYGIDAIIKQINIPLSIENQKVIDMGNTLYQLRHPNILLLYNINWNPPVIQIVTEKCSGYTLYDFIHINNNAFDGMTIITILKEICFALLYLWNARKTIYRRELSSHSIYYTNENQLKLTDYGYTATASEENQFILKALSRPHVPISNDDDSDSFLWIAPEVLMEQQYCEYCDVYSFGIILTELLTYNIPYNYTKENENSILGNIINEGLTPLLPSWKGNELSESTIGKSLCYLTKDCLNRDTSNRPSINEIISSLNAIDMNPIKSFHEIEMPMLIEGFDNIDENYKLRSCKTLSKYTDNCLQSIVIGSLTSSDLGQYHSAIIVRLSHIMDNCKVKVDQQSVDANDYNLLNICSRSVYSYIRCCDTSITEDDTHIILPHLFEIIYILSRNHYLHKDIKSILHINGLSLLYISLYITSSYQEILHNLETVISLYHNESDLKSFIIMLCPYINNKILFSEELCNDEKWSRIIHSIDFSELDNYNNKLIITKIFDLFGQLKNI